MNTLNAFQNQPLDSQLPADNLSVLASEVMGQAFNRLGAQPFAQNGNSAVTGLDCVDCDMSAGNANVPNFGSWFGGDAHPQNGNVTGVGSPGGVAAGGPGGAAPSARVGPAGGPGGTTEWGPQDEAELDKAVSGAGSVGGSGGGSSADASAPGGIDTSSSTPGAAAGDSATGSSGGAANGGVISEFGQTAEGNCASVAVIKAALDKYKDKVFSQVSKTGDGYNVTTQDGKHVTVSKAELQKAAKAAKFDGKPSADKSMAVLMFAVIAKNEAGSGGNFDAALKKLDGGFDPKKAAQDLGLGSKIKDVNPADAKSGQGVVAWSSQHALYEQGGKEDLYGQAKAADGTDGHGHKLEHAFTFA